MNRKYILNIFSFLIALYLSSSLLFNNMNIKNGINCLMLYVIVDCYKNKWHIVLHHLIVLSFYILGINISDKDYMFLAFILIKVEISTVFLQLLNITKNINIGYLKYILQILFLVTFVYYRLIDFPINSIFNKEFIEILIKYNIYNIFIFIFTIFYILNLYWLKLIIDIAKK
jgi:hypothetical protein